MRVLVCGGRTFNNRDFVYSTLDTLHKKERITIIIQGGATGADTLAKLWAITRKIPYIEFSANWKAYGLSAGNIRNALMLTDGLPDKVVAFHGGSGTDNMVKLARANGTTVLDLREK